MSPRMSAVLLAAALLAPAGALRAADTPAAAPDATRAPIDTLAAQAQALAQKGSLLQATAAFDALLDDPRMASAPITQRVNILSAAASAAAALRRYPQARERAQQALALQPDAVLPLYILGMVEVAQEHPDAAAALLVRALRNASSPLQISAPLVRQLQRSLEGMPAQRRAFLQALFDNRWLSDGSEPHDLWLALATLQHEAGDTDAARAAVARIDAPMELIQLRSDKRFDAYVDRTDPRFDPQQAAQRNMDALRVRSVLDRSLDSALAQFSVAALTLGDHAQVLAITDGLAKAVAEGEHLGGPQLRWVGWLMASRALAQRRMGQIDAALQTVQAGARVTGNTPYALALQLNVGLLLTSQGRYEEAAAATATLDGLAPLGTGRQQYIRFRAARHRGDAATAADALARVEALGDEGREVHCELLLVDGRLDDAAAVLIAQLHSKTLRGRTLQSLQDLRTVASLPADAALDARWRQLKARPDVLAAVAEVGRIERYDLFGDESSR